MKVSKHLVRNQKCNKDVEENVDGCNVSSCDDVMFDDMSFEGTQCQDDSKQCACALILEAIKKLSECAESDDQCRQSIADLSVVLLDLK